MFRVKIDQGCISLTSVIMCRWTQEARGVCCCGLSQRRAKHGHQTRRLRCTPCTLDTEARLSSRMQRVHAPYPFKGRHSDEGAQRIFKYPAGPYKLFPGEELLVIVTARRRWFRRDGVVQQRDTQWHESRRRHHSGISRPSSNRNLFQCGSIKCRKPDGQCISPPTFSSAGT